ncbi:unnamed protein product [Amoebophrya sp. A25]|nr:unnamed protein product [Amoebophrya sp. A25]|eukprot:GSA25T00018888001.1
MYTVSSAVAVVAGSVLAHSLSHKEQILTKSKASPRSISKPTAETHYLFFSLVCNYHHVALHLST